MSAAVASSSSSAHAGVDGFASDPSDVAPLSYSSNRKFAEIGLGDLAEVLGVARESLDPTSDRETWSLILSSLSTTSQERQKEREDLLSRLSLLSSQLQTLSATNPRGAWRSPTAHSQALASYGQRTLELAKQIAKLETAISRGEVDVRECKDELGRLERGEVGQDPDDMVNDDDSGAQTWGEEELGRHTLALTMFRQLGFQPLVQPGTNLLASSTRSNTTTTSSLSSSTTTTTSADATISTLFARSDSKGRVTTFKVGQEGSGSDAWERMDESERARRCNEMWDAVE